MPTGGLGNSRLHHQQSRRAQCADANNLGGRLSGEGRPTFHDLLTLRRLQMTDAYATSSPKMGIVAFREFGLLVWLRILQRLRSEAQNEERQLEWSFVASLA
jgi:hypothetical protein